jgi:hypothetical protein
MIQNGGMPGNIMMQPGSSALDPNTIERLNKEKEAELQAALEQKGLIESVCEQSCYPLMWFRKSSVFEMR